MNRLQKTLFVAALGFAAMTGVASAERATWVNDRGEVIQIERDQHGTRVRADNGRVHDYGRDNPNWYRDFRLDREGARAIRTERQEARPTPRQQNWENRPRPPSRPGMD